MKKESVRKMIKSLQKIGENGGKQLMDEICKGREIDEEKLRALIAKFENMKKNRNQ